MATKVDPKIKAIIYEAVTAGLRAGRAQASSTAKDAYKATEKRLYALPVLEGKLENDRLQVKEMKSEGHQKRGKSIVRFNRSGYRVTPEEMLESIILDLESTIACDEYEVVTIRCALEMIATDPYYRAITGKYFDQKSDDEIGDEMICDPSTVWRNRKRLVQRLAVWLYGATAI